MTQNTRIALALAFVALTALSSPALAQITLDPDPLVQGYGNQHVTFALNLSNPSSTPIDAFGFSLQFPANLLQFVKVETAGTLTDGWIAASGIVNTPGEMTVGGFNPTATTGSGVLIHVTFKVTPYNLGTAPVALSAFTDDLAGAASTPGSFEATVGPGAAGLLGSYHGNRYLTALVLQRIDPFIDFDWATGSPDPALPKNDFSIRWTGWVLPDFSETYTFYTITDDGVRLWVDNQLIIDKWVDQSATEWSGQIALTAGVAVPITMEYYERGGDAVAKLLWSSPSRERQTIPPESMLAAQCGVGMGDIDNDGILTGSDAVCTFNIYMQEGQLPATCNFQGYACELDAADANCDAAVTPGDALSVELRSQAGLPPMVCFAQASPVAPAPYDIALTQKVVDDNGTPRLRVTVATTNGQDLDAFGFRLTFPDADLVFQRMEPGYAFSGWLMTDALPSGSGELIAGGFDTTPIASASSVEVMHFYFDFTGIPGTVGGLSLSNLVDDFTGANIVGTITGIGSHAASSFQLFQNYPNPFNPTTSIRFEVPAGTNARVKIAVYSVRGELVRVLLDEQRDAGVHSVSWDGTNEQGAPVTSGIYFYSLTAGGRTESRRMVLLK